MSITKGIVQGGNYTFSAATQTITFSSDYLGLSLSDITYITNIKSGVATVIYDPFDATKGGVLNGLTLTLAYNTTLMADTDPLQIIVGFTPSNPAPINVNVIDTPEQEAQRDLLQSISDDLDLIALAMDQAEGTPLNVRLSSSEFFPKRDAQNAQVTSDAPEALRLLYKVSGDSYVVDTAGYNTLALIGNITSGSGTYNFSVEGSNDYDPTKLTSGTWNPLIVAANTSGSGGASSLTSTTGSVPPFQVFGSSSSYIYIPCYPRYVRIRCSSVISGPSSCLLIGYLRTAQLPTGPFSQIPVNVANVANINIQQIGGSGPSSVSANLLNGSPTSFGGTVVAGTGPLPPTYNFPNAASTLQNSVPYPVGIGGREQPYIGNLAGIFRYITVDGGGRQILGGDTPDTETRTQSKRADGSISGLPPRGVSARSNNMFGGQSLHIEDISQSEGDTIPTLLQQILVELKMLNQQINEIPFTLNQGLHMQNEVAEYRQEEYNNHVNNQ